MNDIGELERAITEGHGCKAVHLETRPVKEVFRGMLVLEGDVEIFQLAGHPKAKKCYAWLSGEGEIITVLEVPPVESAQTAVRAYVRSRAGDL